MNISRMLPALTMAVAVVGTAPDAGAAQVEGHFETGVLVPQGFSSFDMRPTFGADVTKVWSPLRHLGLGLEAGIDGTELPLSRTDGPATLGGADFLTESIVLRPRLMFGPRFVPSPLASLGVSGGSTWLWSRAGSGLAIVPYPTVSAAMQFKFGPGSRHGVRVAVSYTHLWFTHDKALVGMTLAFTWGN